MQLPLILASAALLAVPSAANPPERTGVPAKARVAGRTGMFRSAYEPPKNPRHQQLYLYLQRSQLLERLSDSGSALRLPKPLLIKFAGCEGAVNAWYDPTDGTVTFCYEYALEIQQNSSGSVAHGIPAELSFDGAVTFVLLHETAHAIFDLLKVPLLGREEDAADQVAAFLLLRAGEGIARRVLGGAAWMYLHDSKGRMPDDSDFADVHGLDAQRFYNVLCMAHGSEPASFNGMVEKGYLPKDRAETCVEEYHQVAYAMKQLIDPSMDVVVWERTRAGQKARWEVPKGDAASAPRAK